MSSDSLNLLKLFLIVSSSDPLIATHGRPSFAELLPETDRGGMQLSIAGEFGKLESSSGTTWLSLARLPLPSPSSDSLPSRLWRQCSLKRMVSEGIGSSRRKEENEVARMRFGAGTSCEITLSSMVVLRLYQLRVTPSRIVSKRVQSSKRLVSGGESKAPLVSNFAKSNRFDSIDPPLSLKVGRHDASSLCFVLSHGATLSESLRLAAEFHVGSVRAGTSARNPSLCRRSFFSLSDSSARRGLNFSSCSVTLPPTLLHSNLSYAFILLSTVHTTRSNAQSQPDQTEGTAHRIALARSRVEAKLSLDQ